MAFLLAVIILRLYVSCAVVHSMSKVTENHDTRYTEHNDSLQDDCFFCHGK